VIRRIDLAILRDFARRLRRNRAARRREGLYPLDVLIVYVTMRCNARCEHCFCWQQLNTNVREMTLPEFEKLADSIPRLRQLLLTGGEPMLRADLADIARAFARRGKAETILINSNGLQPEKIAALAGEFKTEFPGVGLVFQISLDGLEETHDRMRGVPGGFRKALESLRRVYALQPHYPALSAHALTVITDANHSELVALNDYLRREIAPDIQHGFELVRGIKTTVWRLPPEIAETEVAPKTLGLPPIETFGRIARDLRAINRRGPYRANAFHVHNLAQLRMVATRREQYPCVTAGQSVGVVYCGGDVAHCEFTRPFANLMEFDYDFPALWRSAAAQQRRAQIRRCFCTHGCFHGKSVEYSWKGFWETMYRALMGR
jgi:MoaA/NifB/PqqE/SkfB family radical SAM enzyme